MTAQDKTRELMNNLWKHDISATFELAETLRRAQMALHRWAELECGDGNDYASWAIERDEVTGLPYMVRYSHASTRCVRTRTPDREKGALARVAELCKEHGLHYYHQTDPRGCALYVSKEPLTGQNYVHGVACC